MRAAARAPGRSRCGPSRRARGPRWRFPHSSPWRPGGVPCCPSRRAPRRRRLPETTTASSSCAAGAMTRRIPYAFFVTRPALKTFGRSLRRFQNGHHGGWSLARRAPTAGRPRRSATRRTITDPPMVEDGAERVYLVPHLDRPVVNFGVSVVSVAERSRDRPLAARLARRERRSGRGGHAGRTSIR